MKWKVPLFALAASISVCLFELDSIIILIIIDLITNWGHDHQLRFWGFFSSSNLNAMSSHQLAFWKHHCSIVWGWMTKRVLKSPFFGPISTIFQTLGCGGHLWGNLENVLISVTCKVRPDWQKLLIPEIKMGGKHQIIRLRHPFKIFVCCAIYHFVLWFLQRPFDRNS